jgi:hypothetical protein
MYNKTSLSFHRQRNNCSRYCTNTNHAVISTFLITANNTKTKRETSTSFLSKKIHIRSKASFQDSITTDPVPSRQSNRKRLNIEVKQQPKPQHPTQFSASSASSSLPSLSSAITDHLQSSACHRDRPQLARMDSA